MEKEKGQQCPQNKQNVKSNNTITRLPHQLLKKALSRAYSMWDMYVDGYQFFIKQRDKHIHHAKGYVWLIKEYEHRIDDAMLESKRCDNEADQYLKLMKQARGEITQLENQGGYDG